MNIKTQIANSKLSSFEKKFWTEALNPETKPFVVQGSCYHVAPELPPEKRRFGGFGGSEFRIHMFGKDDVVVSHNVWCNGKIPEELGVEDTAEFLWEA